MNGHNLTTAKVIKLKNKTMKAATISLSLPDSCCLSPNAHLIQIYTNQIQVTWKEHKQKPMNASNLILDTLVHQRPEFKCDTQQIEIKCRIYLPANLAGSISTFGPQTENLPFPSLSHNNSGYYYYLLCVIKQCHWLPEINHYWVYQTFFALFCLCYESLHWLI